MRDETIWNEASKLSGNTEVTATINALRDVVHQAHAVAADRLTAELAAVTFADIYDPVTIEDGSLALRGAVCSRS